MHFYRSKTCNRSILLDLHISCFRFAKILCGVFLFVGFFSKVTTRFWQISSHDQPYSPFLPTQTLLFPSVRSNTERSHHRHQYPVSSPWPCTSGDTGKQYKTEGETSAIWGNFWGLTWFARWSYSPGVSPWHFLTAHCLLGERCAELAQLQELV